MESQLRLTVVLGFWHCFYTLPEIIVSICGVHLFETFRYFYSLVRKGSELFGVSADSGRLTVVLGFYRHCLYTPPEVIVPICVVHLSDTFRYFYSLVRRGFEPFGVLALTDSGIMILALLIYPTRIYCVYLWCAPL